MFFKQFFHPVEIIDIAFDMFCPVDINTVLPPVQQIEFITFLNTESAYAGAYISCSANKKNLHYYASCFVIPFKDNE
jgi:hypothetical protein